MDPEKLLEKLYKQQQEQKQLRETLFTQHQRQSEQPQGATSSSSSSNTSSSRSDQLRAKPWKLPSDFEILGEASKKRYYMSRRGPLLVTGFLLSTFMGSVFYYTISKMARDDFREFKEEFNLPKSPTNSTTTPSPATSPQQQNPKK